MADLISIFGGEFLPIVEQEPDRPEIQLERQMRAAGIEPPQELRLDGELHRFRNGGKSNDKSGWYVIYPDGVAAGKFGCWRSGIECNFRADTGREISAAEEMAHTARMAQAKKARDEALKKRHEITADTVDQIWSSCIGADNSHPYLMKKGIRAHGARVTGDGRLVVPLFSPAGELASLQYIDSDGGKLYHSGGKTGGAFWWVGAVEGEKIFVAEGFATAATIHEHTQAPCVVAYSASNLVSVTQSIREQFQDAQIVIVADNDASGIGQKYADQASAKFNAKVITPPAQGDANDYAQAGGDLLELLEPTSKAAIEKLKVVFGDELGDEYEAPNELVEGLITIGSSVVVYGDSNSGKTFWALAVAKSIATGSDCFGLRVDPGLVIYLATESPSSIRSRMQAIKKFYKCTLENLAIVPVPLNFYEGESDASDVIDLVKEVQEKKNKPVRLIIGDTLARMSAGANENSGEDMAPVMARFDRVATATGAALMIIHHNGKDAAKGARGWSGIRAHIDTEIEIVEKDGVRSATVTKQRELPSKGNCIYFNLEIVPMGVTKFGEQATTCVAIHDAEAALIQPHKKPSKMDEGVRTLERAWHQSGGEEMSGMPYLSRSALKEILIKEGATERTARNKTEASRQNGIIAPLINAGVIEAMAHGWVFVNDAQISAMMIQKNSKKDS